MRFADTDAMGVVHHANYLAYFEAGRVDAMRQVGADYRAVVERGLHLVVVEAHVRYVKAARFDDLLAVHTSVSEIGAARFAFSYHVLLEDDLIATGSTVHACVDAARMRP
ncbi:MAG TPA: thioesterase family protein, partial [Chloroflexota bacterium]|nr:thioesterase family protein [Chloroflexota bacterium]